MKETNYIVFILLVLFLSSCGSDDECTPETVAGTYNFQSAACDPDTDEDMDGINSLENSTLFTIEAVDENTISITGEDGNAVEFPLNGCSFAAEPESIDFFGLMISASYSGEFDGDELMLNITTEISGQIEGQDPIEEMKTTCTVVASR